MSRFIPRYFAVLLYEMLVLLVTIRWFSLIFFTFLLRIDLILHFYWVLCHLSFSIISLFISLCLLLATACLLYLAQFYIVYLYSDTCCDC
jgi:hypothetical protein